MIRFDVADPEARYFGDFSVYKEITVEENGTQKGVVGVVIQSVARQTRATTTETPPRVLTTTAQIAEFTSNQVLYASDSYSELFPIVDGQCKYADRFQGGAIASYTTPKRGKPYVDADPAIETSGTISIVGTCEFIKTDMSVIEAMSAAAKKKGTIEFQGVSWSFSPNTPANGLGYSTAYTVESGPKHSVHVTWDPKVDEALSKVTSTVLRGGRRKTRRRRASRRVRV